MKRLIFACLAATALRADLCRADEARIPIFQPATTITQPGHYILTRDIATTSGAVVRIQADNVTVDLNGRTISGGTVNSLIVIADGFKDIAIRNGRLSGGAVGIIYTSSSVGTRLRVENVEIAGAETGIYVSGAELVSVLSCRIVAGGQGMGISAAGVGDSSYAGRFLDNVIENVQATAMSLSGLRAGLVRGNVITRFGTTLPFSFGIQLGTSVIAQSGGNVIERNTIRGSDDDYGIGIFSGPDNIVAENAISDLGATGIFIGTDGNRIIGNVSSHTACGICTNGNVSRTIVERNHTENGPFNGIVMQGDYNLLDGNVSVGNAFNGIVLFGTGNAYRNNMLRGNTGGAIATSATDAGGNIL
jgi:hypothetical protein